MRRNLEKLRWVAPTITAALGLLAGGTLLCGTSSAQSYHDASDKAEGYDTGREEQARHAGIRAGVPANDTLEQDQGYYSNQNQNRFAPRSNNQGQNQRRYQAQYGNRNNASDDRNQESRNQDNGQGSAQDRNGGRQNQDRNRAYSSDSQNDRNQANRGNNQNDENFGVAWSNSDNRLSARRVADNSPLAQAGLERGDEIVSVNGRRVSSQNELIQALRASQGRQAALIVLRDGNRSTIYFAAPQTGNQNWNNTANNSSYGNGRSSNHGFLGVQLDDRHQHEAMVRQVYNNSPAQQAGVRPGDAIQAVNGQQIQSPDDLTAAVSRLEPGSPVQLTVGRTQVMTIQARLGNRDEQSQQANFGRNSNNRGQRGQVDDDNRQGNQRDQASDRRNDSDNRDRSSDRNRDNDSDDSSDND